MTTKMYQSDILPISITVLVQVCQRLSLVFYNDLYHRFTYVHLASLLALTQSVSLPGGFSSRDSIPERSLALRYIVRVATLFRPLASSGGTDGSLLMEWKQLLNTASCRNPDLESDDFTS